VFTACKDNGADELLTPSNAVSNLAFNDFDVEEGKIGGLLQWTLPEKEEFIDSYAIYLGESATAKTTRLGNVVKGVSSFEIPLGTDYKEYILVVAVNTAGESSNVTSLLINDNTKPAAASLKGFYILNCGNESENNASLSYYNYETGKLTADVYRTANGKGLGDSAEQLLQYGSKMYITVTASNRIVVLDKDAKEIKSITPEGSEPMNPRCMVADKGKIYISYFYGHSVAVLDTASLEIEKIIPVGRYPEQLAISGDKIYVANSGGLDFGTGTGYANTVSVIDRQSLTVTKDIEVIINPVKLAADSQGDIYVISMGDYSDVKSTLQRIDGETNSVTEMGNASDMALAGDELYTLYAQWGATAVTYMKYDTSTEKIISDNFLPDGGGISPSKSPVIAVNPENKEILMLEAPYTATGSIYLFTSEGKLKGESIDTGGYYAKWISFVY
jgi:DNA-binding beta-propeller fold protein YncE